MDTLHLSRRNLLTLLSKLDRAKAGMDTKCAIIKHRQPDEDVPYNQTMESVMVIAVEDEIYYAAQDRPAGAMHPYDDPSKKGHPIQ
jgi:hypothetical protein